MSQRNGGIPTSVNRAVNNLQGKLKNSYLNLHEHNAVPGYNLSLNPNIDNYDEDNLMQLFKEFPYDSNLPKPLLPPARLPQCVLRNEDPALQLLSIKSEIKDDINRITEYHEKYKKDMKPCHKNQIKWKKNNQNMEETYLPRYVAELAEILESDPDPEFKGEYNWYYTGGSLDHLILSDKNILIFPYIEEIVATPIIERSKSLWKPNLSGAAKCNLDNTLYEIRHSTMSGSSCRILGRQKYSCNLYSLSEVNGRLRLSEIHRQHSNVPYISADLSSIEWNKYCLANNERSVELRDLTRIKCLNSISIPNTGSPPDNWMNIKFQESDPHSIIVVDRCCLYHIDSRTPSDQPDLTLCPKDHLEMCESLSVNTSSIHNSFYQYLGAYHSLVLCDSRFGNSCVVQKWTHQFKSPPLFCRIIDRNSEEIITLSSQLSGENSVILNTWTSESQMHSYSLPFMPLSLSETLGASRDEGKCLDPSLRDRLELCNAGTTLNMNDRNEVTFFTQNSIGDIFYQCITYEKNTRNTSKANKKSVIALAAWEEAYLKQRKAVKPLVVSEKVNMGHILDKMKNANLTSESKAADVTTLLPKWFQTIEELNSYVDILAPELLSVWDVKENTVASSVTPHQKVLNWLEEETSSQNLSQSQNIIQSQEDQSVFNGTNEILSQELISVSQNIEQNYTLRNNTATEQILHDIPASETTIAQKKVAKKRKYIAGF